MLRHLPPNTPNANVIVGLDAPDDAGVYRIAPDIAIVQTVDFFTPIVDDPYAFGQVAAANSLSDVYAMGARPITALNIIGYPIDKLPKDVLAEILRGGADKVRESGATIIGGHSIDDAEPKYGLSATGLVHPDHILTKGGARPGDKLVLTKPIGIGIITTAIKRGLVSADVEAEVVRVMATLNNVTEALHAAGVKSATDITGFGLLGHGAEMAAAGGVGFRISYPAVPVLDAARTYAEQDVFPGGSRANHRYLQERVTYPADFPLTQQLLLCDAVTSGGLLAAVPAERVEQLLQDLQAAGTLAHAVIGEVIEGPAGSVQVTG